MSVEEGGDVEGTLVGSLVRIHSVDEALRPLAPTDDWSEAVVDEAHEPMDVNGMTGICMGHDATEKAYLVHTFESGWFLLPITNVEQFTCLTAEEGGFDICWPMDELTGEMFTPGLHHSLREKGYCVVQMVTTPQTRNLAAEESKRPLHKFKKFYAEDEQLKLGKDNTTRVIELESPDEAVEEYQEPENPYLDDINRDLSDTALALSDVCHMNGLYIWGRTDSWIRLPYGSAPDPSPSPANDPEFYKEFLMWVTNRKVCMLYVIDCEGGQLTLFPRDDDKGGVTAIESGPSHAPIMTVVSQPSSDTPKSDEPSSDEPKSDEANTDEPASAEPSSDRLSSGEPTTESPSIHTDEIKIPLRKGQLIVFHNEKLDYSYQPEGDSLAMQSWLLTEPKDVKIVELPKPPRQELPMIHICSAMERFPGGCYGADKSWEMFFVGSDLLIPPPEVRMEYEEFYEADPDAILRGKAYIHHGSFVDHDHSFAFDHEFWGYTYEEGGTIGLHQRWVLETGYVAMHKAGYHKEEMNNQRIGSSIGDYQQEWNYMSPMHKLKIIDDRFAWTIQTLAYHLGWRGPTIHADTACSASLVALNGMAHFMQRGQHGTQEQVRSACCMGVLAMLNFGGWIGECAGTMLSYKGRCFTFDSSADGFIRGEGCCAVNLQLGEPWEEASFDEKGRLGVLRATCCNQDGRSASLTAPSGPSQQVCIRSSLQSGMMDPKEVVVGECHGTGTALGDPIEVGANKAVFGVKNREFNHSVVSAKAHIGHTESTAGVCGFIKSLLMVIHGCTTADPHVHALNSHLDMKGYDCMVPSEVMDFGRIINHGGVSSFGFGGTNTRGDIWARVMKGPRKGGTETNLDASEAYSFAKYSMKEGHLPQEKEPKLSISWGSVDGF